MNSSSYEVNPLRKGFGKPIYSGGKTLENEKALLLNLSFDGPILGNITLGNYHTVTTVETRGESRN